MLKQMILNNLLEKYILEVEKSEKFIKHTSNSDEILDEIQKALGFDFTGEVEGLIGVSCGIIAEEMYLKGLNDGMMLSEGI